MITINIFFWAILSSTVIATIVGVLLNWIKEYFQEKSKRNNITQEKLYGKLTYYLLMIRALNINREQLIKEISQEPTPDSREGIFSKFSDVTPINNQWWNHILSIKGELENNAGYIRKEHFKIVENFLDGFIKREITQNGTSTRTTKERVNKIFDSLKELDSKIIGS